MRDEPENSQGSPTLFGPEPGISSGSSSGLDVIKLTDGPELVKQKYIDAKERKTRKRGRPRKSESSEPELKTPEADAAQNAAAWRGAVEGLYVGYIGVLNFAMVKAVRKAPVVSPEAESAIKTNLGDLLIAWGGEIPEKWRPVVGLGLATVTVIVDTLRIAEAEKNAPRSTKTE